MSIFPPEMIDHVLSFLQWDQATLKVCAEAHPSLSNLAERHLYRHLTIQDHTSWYSDGYCPHVLLKLIVDNPGVVKHVRSLRMFLTSYAGYRALEPILSAVTQLQAILLSFSSCWDSIHESFRTSFTNCLQLPTLTDVKILQVDSFPLWITPVHLRGSHCPESSVMSLLHLPLYFHH